MKIDKRFAQEFVTIVTKSDWLPWLFDRIALWTGMFLLLAVGAAVQHYFPAAATVFFICSGTCAAITITSYIIVLVAMADSVEDDD